MSRWVFKLDTIYLFILIWISYFIYFNGLGDYSVRMWDEARNGVNAIEMLRSGNFLVPTFNIAPDLWNTKPPLLIWIIVVFFKILGTNELALRLPSALAATGTVVSLYYFGSRILGSKLIGFLAGLILLSAFGFSDIHIGRSGDYDSLLTLLTFLGAGSFFVYLQRNKTKFLFWSIIFFTLAVLTKGIAGVLIVPAIIIYSLIFGHIGFLISNTIFWRSLFVGGLVIVGYYLNREIVNPGYLAAVWKNEIFTRSLQSNDIQRQTELLYYWNWLRTFRFQYWTYWVPFTVLSVFFTKDIVTKRWVYFSTLVIGSYYLIISIAQTKYLWYDAQLYPFACLLIAVLLVSVIKKIPFPLWLIPTLILGYYLQRFIRTNLAYINRPDLEKSNSCYQYGYWFRDLSNPQNGYTASHYRAEYCMPFYFYMILHRIPIKPVESLSVGEKVLSCDSITINQINDQFVTNQLVSDPLGCKLFNITGKK